MLIADEMGVGKTVQALALAACYQVRVCVCVKILQNAVSAVVGCGLLAAFSLEGLRGQQDKSSGQVAV